MNRRSFFGALALLPAVQLAAKELPLENVASVTEVTGPIFDVAPDHWLRPEVECVAELPANITHMTTFKERLIVSCDDGCVYFINPDNRPQRINPA